MEKERGPFLLLFVVCACYCVEIKVNYSVTAMGWGAIKKLLDSAKGSFDLILINLIHCRSCVASLLTMNAVSHAYAKKALDVERHEQG